jgi:hypothetical protein
MKDQFVEDHRRPSKRTTRCIMKAMTSSKYFENSIKVVMLGEVEISDEHKAKERKNLIENMRDMYDNIFHC